MELRMGKKILYKMSDENIGVHLKKKKNLILQEIWFGIKLRLVILSILMKVWIQ